MSIATARPPSGHPSARTRTSTSPSNPFANLDPHLHSLEHASSSSSAQTRAQPDSSTHSSRHAGHTGRSLSPNRLTDFAQHVLGVDGADATGGSADAQNLLAFTAGEDGFLPPAGFSELMREAEVGADGEGLLGVAVGNGNDPDGSGADGDDGGMDGTFEPEGEALDDLGLDLSDNKSRNAGGRKRRRDDGEDGMAADVVRVKKDSHKEVERRRRDNINEGINEIARLIPGGADKMGKGTLLRRAAEYMAELVQKAEGVDGSATKREQEKDELRNAVEVLGADASGQRPLIGQDSELTVQTELALLNHKLEEEQARSIRFETAWREAEDRAAQSQFELERLRGELEQARNG